jgi:hypothetical protein
LTEKFFLPCRILESRASYNKRHLWMNSL